MAEQRIPAFIAKAGVTYRVLIPYRGELHILQRLRLGKDVSFYLFGDTPKEILHGQSTIKAGETRVRIDITKGSVIDDPSTLKSDHTSFHGSGVVKSTTGRHIGHPLRTLNEQVTVCSVIFPHISKLPIIHNLRKSDVTINYPIDEACPLVLNIIATPRSKASRIEIPNAIVQWSYVFIYEQLLEKDDLLIILHFYHSQGDWLLDKAIVYPTDIRQFKNKTL
jgi:hypothetical protein